MSIRGGEARTDKQGVGRGSGDVGRGWRSSAWTQTCGRRTRIPCNVLSLTTWSRHFCVCFTNHIMCLHWILLQYLFCIKVSSSRHIHMTMLRPSLHSSFNGKHYFLFWFIKKIILCYEKNIIEVNKVKAIINRCKDRIWAVF